MAKLATTASVLALCALAGCATNDDPNYSAAAPLPPASTIPSGTPATSAAPGAPVTSASGAPVTTAPSASVAPAPIAYRPGSGIVESVSLERPGSSAGAGGTAASGTVGSIGLYRMTIRMDDGSLQTVVQDNPNFRAGDRVQLTADGRVVRL